MILTLKNGSKNFLQSTLQFSFVLKMLKFDWNIEESITSVCTAMHFNFIKFSILGDD